MKYRVRYEIEVVVEADDEKEAVEQAWYDIWEEAGASNPDPDWLYLVERVKGE